MKSAAVVKGFVKKQFKLETIKASDGIIQSEQRIVVAQFIGLLSQIRFKQRQLPNN